MSVLSSRIQQLKEESARQTAAWHAVRDALRALPDDVVFAIPDSVLQELDSAAEPPRGPALTILSHHVRA